MITNRKESVTMRLDNYMLFLERFAAENQGVSYRYISC